MCFKIIIYIYLIFNNLIILIILKIFKFYYLFSNNKIIYIYIYIKIN